MNNGTTNSTLPLCVFLFSLQVHYLQQPCSNYVLAAVEAVIDIHKADMPGDILVFLTGQQVSDCQGTITATAYSMLQDAGLLMGERLGNSMCQP
jgi:HrpA-like RNA helicase